MTHPHPEHPPAAPAQVPEWANRMPAKATHPALQWAGILITACLAIALVAGAAGLAVLAVRWLVSLF